jgi:hypothetical protein
MERKDKSASRAALEAMREQDAHTEQKEAETLPEGDAPGHPRSHAAHLNQPGPVHTKPAGNLREGSSPGERREPPQGQPKH